jgi:hypothetical protein
VDSGLVICIDIEVIADLGYRASVLYGPSNPVEFTVIDDLLVSYIPVLGVYRLYRRILEDRKSGPYAYTPLARW